MIFHTHTPSRVQGFQLDSVHSFLKTKKPPQHPVLQRRYDRGPTLLERALSGEYPESAAARLEARNAGNALPPTLTASVRTNRPYSRGAAARSKAPRCMFRSSGLGNFQHCPLPRAANAIAAYGFS